MNILLLSAYDAQSHQYWREGMIEHIPDACWTVLTLPARHFNWRIRGNSLSWAHLEQDTLNQNYDLLIATSMTDLSALRGMVPHLATIPTLVYFHENQFAYPTSEQQVHSLEPKIVNLYTALCADQLLFNSRYNMETFLHGVGALLKKLPDFVPPKVVEQLRSKSDVVPVPLKPSAYMVSACDSSPSDLSYAALQSSEVCNILWNHRWEYDKGPDRLLEVIKRMPEEANVKFHIVGQCFRHQPNEFNEIRELLVQRHWLGEWGYVESQTRYQAILNSSDVVLSTAIHDFQGLSVLEAVAAGAVPVVPDRLAYQELFANIPRYSSDMENLLAEACAAVDVLMVVVQALKKRKQGDEEMSCPAFRPDISRYSWPSLLPDYMSTIKRLVNSR